MPTVRLEREGLFGPVGVVDTAESRRFTIRGVLQGASLLQPPASSVDPSLPPGPGPVIETRYQLAWFLAGQRHPAGRGLMLGLGGGSGAAGLLHEFPEMALDALEADPTMAAMAREFHPLVSHYERSGRLRLSVADAEDHLAGNEQRYDFVIADTVVDGDSLPRIDSASFVTALARAAPEVWFRVFGSLPDAELEPILSRFETAGLPVDWLYSPVSVGVPLPRTRDWILAAGVRQAPDPEMFVAYGSVPGATAERIREAYRKLASEPLPAAEARLGTLDREVGCQASGVN